MEGTAGDFGIVVVVSLPIKGMTLSGQKQDALAVLPGLLVGEDTLVLRPEGGIMILSLKEMRRDHGFSISFLDSKPVVVPPNMIGNMEDKVNRLVRLLSLDQIQETLSLSRGKNLHDDVLRAAEGPSGLPGIPQEPPVVNSFEFVPRYLSDVEKGESFLRGMTP